LEDPDAEMDINSWWETIRDLLLSAILCHIVPMAEK
jgi:hypothetical protein